MEKLKVFSVVPSIPKKLKALHEMANNLWFSWHHEAVNLFQRTDRQLWEETDRNPTLLLGRVKQDRLKELQDDEGFTSSMHKVYEDFKKYMAGKAPSQHKILNETVQMTVAYFSMEYGLADCVPIYSGGLGVLSGDHLKSASDLSIPIVGVGLAYQKGYFRQLLDPDGWQRENYPDNDFANMPIMLERDQKGEPVSVSVSMDGRKVEIHIWRIQVGRVPLYLLDTNVVSNAPEDRGITAQLYGGDSRNRIRQEIVLGIGGIRALKELGHNPAVFHLNEGHAAFASLERARFYVSEKNLSFEEAREIVTSSTAFTTHTPVPAGIDTFDQNLMANYFGNFVSEMGISFNKLMDFGRKNIYDQQEPFNMAILAMNFSAFINGVSKLHSTVTRKMWSALWPHLPERDTPIIGITNGIHIPSWISMDMAGLFDRYLGPGWIEEPVGQRAWDRIETIPDEELWRTHERRRERLVAFTRERVRRQLRRRVMPHSEVESATAVLDPEALTIVFCRRFATYKRASLILSDEARLARLLNDPKHPVQLIFAGKAHPHDDAGKDLIKKIVNLAAKEEFRHRVVFIEDYDMNVARYLVQGADVWLNNPRRPLEASGTSGMKATANGALNLSILDGWWCEGYNSMNGWAIGAGEEYLDTAYQDKVESRSLYEILESEIIPLFYERGPDNIPRKWVRRMKNAMKSICPVFNSHRMLAEYNSRFYVPAAENTHRLTARSFAGVRELVEWKMRIYSNWDNLHVEDVQLDMNDEIPVGTDLKVKASINLAELRPEDITVDLYYGPLDAWGSLQYSTITPMHPSSGRNGHYSYTGTIPCEATGRFGFRVRILPRHKLMASPYSLHVIHWS